MDLHGCLSNKRNENCGKTGSSNEQRWAYGIVFQNKTHQQKKKKETEESRQKQERKKAR